MKAIKLTSLLLLFLVASCSSIKVTSDYDTTANFSNYKTFAFYKTGIDKVAISDLDKRRILKAIETQLEAKGLTKSENPDLIVNIFTKARQQVEINNNNFYFGWRPWYYGPDFGMQISKYTEGSLFIDLIDANKKELVWQGVGSGALNTSGNVAKKEVIINQFVSEIMAKYPPSAK